MLSRCVNPVRRAPAAAQPRLLRAVSGTQGLGGPVARADSVSTLGGGSADGGAAAAPPLLRSPLSQGVRVRVRVGVGGRPRRPSARPRSGAPTATVLAVAEGGPVHRWTAGRSECKGALRRGSGRRSARCRLARVRFGGDQVRTLGCLNLGPVARLQPAVPPGAACGLWRKVCQPV